MEIGIPLFKFEIQNLNFPINSNDGIGYFPDNGRKSGTRIIVADSNGVYVHCFNYLSNVLNNLSEILTAVVYWISILITKQLAQILNETVMIKY